MSPNEGQETDPIRPDGSGWSLAGRTVLVRARFVLFLVLVAGVAAFWNDVGDRLSRFRRPAANEGARAETTEFFCPMHPGVVRAGEGSCPICGMPLSRREHRGTAPLPEGVGSRVTLSPMRVAQAGIRTEEVGSQPLTLEVGGSGVVHYDPTRIRRISSGFAGRVLSIEGSVDGVRRSKGAPLLRFMSRDVRRAVQSYTSGLRQLRDAESKPGADRLRDQSETLRREVIELGVDPDGLAKVDGLPDPLDDIVIRAPFDCVVVRCEVRAGEQVSTGAPLIEVADPDAVIAELRVPRAEGSFIRPGLATEVVDPLDAGARFAARVVQVSDAVDEGTQSIAVRLAIAKAGDRLRPGMYVAATIRVPFATIEPWKTMQASAPGGTGVIAVPETAVVDTGRLRIVYVESSPGVFDAREVVLGPRAGAFYPVVSGVTPGMRIATAGSFLLDAETRFATSANGTSSDAR